MTLSSITGRFWIVDQQVWCTALVDPDDGRAWIVTDDGRYYDSCATNINQMVMAMMLVRDELILH